MQKITTMTKINHYLITFLDRSKNEVYSKTTIAYTINIARDYARLLLANDMQGAKTFTVKKIK